MLLRRATDDAGIGRVRVYLPSVPSVPSGQLTSTPFAVPNQRPQEEGRRDEQRRSKEAKQQQSSVEYYEQSNNRAADYQPESLPPVLFAVCCPVRAGGPCYWASFPPANGESPWLAGPPARPRVCRSLAVFFLSLLLAAVAIYVSLCVFLPLSTLYPRLSSLFRLSYSLLPPLSLSRLLAIRLLLLSSFLSPVTRYPPKTPSSRSHSYQSHALFAPPYADCRPPDRLRCSVPDSPASPHARKPALP